MRSIARLGDICEGEESGLLRFGSDVKGNGDGQDCPPLQMGIK
jgi:hypothetical protein